ncbi:hypothetical protein QTO34_016934, partial [Cnephaeus nilssonii]
MECLGRQIMCTAMKYKLGLDLRRDTSVMPLRKCRGPPGRHLGISFNYHQLNSGSLDKSKVCCNFDMFKKQISMQIDRTFAMPAIGQEARGGGVGLGVAGVADWAGGTLSSHRQRRLELSVCAMAVLRHRRGLWGSELTSHRGPSKAGELGACPLRHQAFQKPPPRRRLLKGLGPIGGGSTSTAACFQSCVANTRHVPRHPLVCCWVAQRPMLCPSPWHLAVLTASLCGNSAAMYQVEGGAWDLGAQVLPGAQRQGSTHPPVAVVTQRVAELLDLPWHNPQPVVAPLSSEQLRMDVTVVFHSASFPVVLD